MEWEVENLNPKYDLKIKLEQAYSFVCKFLRPSKKGLWIISVYA